MRPPTDRQLRWSVAILAALVLFEIVGFAVWGKGPRPVAGWQFGLFCLVPLAFTISFFPMMYRAWFRNGRSGALVVARTHFFWLLAGAFAFIWFMIYTRMVFKWW
jgi:hypothetical protein